MTSVHRDGLDLLIFDLDGTLTDTWPIATVAFRAAIAEFLPHPFSNEELMSLAGPAEEGILQQLLPDRWEECFARYLEEYASGHSGRPTLFSGIALVLDLLRSRGVPLAIVTGKTMKAVEITLRHADIGHYFATVEAGSPKGNVKSEAIRAIVDRRGVEGSRAAYVGDTAADMHAANEAGVVAVGAAWAETAHGADLTDMGADVVFPEVDGFRSWLESKTRVSGRPAS